MQKKPRKTTETLIRVVEHWEVREEGSETFFSKEVERVIPPPSPDGRVKIPETPPTQRDYIAEACQLKDYLRGMGYRICAKPTCLERIPDEARATKIYCSEQCQNAHKSQRWRESNPKAKMRSDLQYLSCLEEEGDLAE